MKNRISILNTFVDNYTIEQTVDLIEQSIENKNKLTHVVVNASKIVDLQKNIELRKSINDCDLINADGQAVVWSSRLLKKPIKERVAGIDLMERLVKLAYQRSYKIFFFGANPNVVERVVSKYSSIYSPDIVAGYRDGYYDKCDERLIAETIKKSNPDILFVAISSPKKEIFLNKYQDYFSNISFTMGVGGSFDVVSGLVKRAPLWMQNSGLEWLYRFLQEPKRMWKRYLVGNTKFILLVLRAYFKKRQ